MIRDIRRSLDEAEADDACRLVVFSGAGPRGFCAGGDIRELYGHVEGGDHGAAMGFFREEYAMDLAIHRFSRAVVVAAHGITMGGGLGISAGADLVLAAEDTVMAMPETRIGFFPDVGATAWLWSWCREGYPHFLGLAGAELRGAEAVRAGLATHLLSGGAMPRLVGALLAEAAGLPADRGAAREMLKRRVIAEGAVVPAPKADLDSWVARHFSGAVSVSEIAARLDIGESCPGFGDGPRRALGERSPTSLVLSMGLLAANHRATLEDAFSRELRAAGFIIGHHDYREGVRVHMIERLRKPQWDPPTLEAAVKALPERLLN